MCSEQQSSTIFHMSNSELNEYMFYAWICSLSLISSDYSQVAYWTYFYRYCHMKIESYLSIVCGHYVIYHIYQHWKWNKILFMVCCLICSIVDFVFSFVYYTFRLGLTIDRIYILLEQSMDEKFLLCLISLLKNLFHEKDLDALLPLFNCTKLQAVSRSNDIIDKWHVNDLNLDFTTNVGQDLFG
jgi:hypothetical protein